MQRNIGGVIMASVGCLVKTAFVSDSLRPHTDVTPGWSFPNNQIILTFLIFTQFTLNALTVVEEIHSKTHIFCTSLHLISKRHKQCFTISTDNLLMSPIHLNLTLKVDR